MKYGQAWSLSRLELRMEKIMMPTFFQFSKRRFDGLRVEPATTTLSLALHMPPLHHIFVEIEKKVLSRTLLFRNLDGSVHFILAGS